jgi:hypothetical protein
MPRLGTLRILKIISRWGICGLLTRVASAYSSGGVRNVVQTVSRHLRSQPRHHRRIQGTGRRLRRTTRGKSLSLLYVSCHPVLEKDELDILSELGHRVQTIGFYMDPDDRSAAMIRHWPRSTSDADFLAHFRQINPDYRLPDLHEDSGFCWLPSKLTAGFDAILICHYPHILRRNVEHLRRSNVILRTIGFPMGSLETEFQFFLDNHPNTRVIRMSTTESLAPNYVGHDAIITQSFDPRDYLPWSGGTQRVLTVNKMFKKRADTCGFGVYEEVMRHFVDERMLIGSQNEDIPYAQEVDFHTLKELYRTSSIYFNTCSKPACVTYGLIEAMGVGMPIVSFGPGLGSVQGMRTYPIDELIKDGINGFLGNSRDELVGKIRLLLKDRRLQDQFSTNIKETARRFHKEVIRGQWESALGRFFG